MGADGVDLLGGDVELTEFTEIDVESVKGVRKGASGVPILLMKGLPDDGEPAAKADGEPGPTHGAFTGTHSHAHAANGAQGDDDTHSHEHTHDGDGDHGHGHGASKSEGPPAWHSPAALLVRLARENPGTGRGDLFKAVAADGTVDEQPDIDGGQQAIALIAKLIGYEAAELGAGDLDEIRDIGMLCDAASTLKWWIQGEQAGQDQAEGCGCPPGCACCMGMVMASTDDDPPGPDDTAKSTVAEGQPGVQTDGEGTGSQALAKAVKDAVAEAMTPVQKELRELRAFKAKVEALPVPGGPVMSAVRGGTRAQGDTDLLAKAAYYREKAEMVTDPADRAGYRQLARETEAKAKATTA